MNSGSKQSIKWYIEVKLVTVLLMLIAWLISDTKRRVINLTILITYKAVGINKEIQVEDVVNEAHQVGNDNQLMEDH